MIRFKQKEFVLPLLGMGAGAVGNAIGVGGMAMTGAQMVQSSSQAKDQEAQMEAQQKAQEKQNKRLTNALNNIAQNNPGAAAQAGTMVGQAQFSYSSVMQREFAYKTSDITGFGKDLWKFAKSDTMKKYAANGLAFGGLMATGGYVADKLIQRDQKKRTGENDNQSQSSGIGKKLAIGGASLGVLALHPKTRSIMTSGIKRVTNLTGMGWKGALGATAMGAAMPAIGYLANRSQEQGAANNTQQQRQYSEEKEMSTGKKLLYGAGAVAGTVGLGMLAKRNPTLRKWGNSILDKSGWNSYKKVKDPGFIHTNQGTWGTIKGIFSKDPRRSLKHIAKTINNTLGMANGETGLQTFHNHLTKPGGSGSKLTGDVANFVKNHQTTALLGGTAAGMAGMAATFDLGEKVANKGFRMVDKNAYKYQDSQEEQLQ